MRFNTRSPHTSLNPSDSRRVSAEDSAGTSQGGGDPDSGMEPRELVSEGQVVTGHEKQGLSQVINLEKQQAVGETPARDISLRGPGATGRAWGHIHPPGVAAARRTGAGAPVSIEGWCASASGPVFEGERDHVCKCARLHV